MNSTKAFFLGVLVAAVVAVGVFFLFPHKSPQTAVGGIYNANGFNAQYFPNGLTYSKLTPSSLGVSTSTPALFGSASGGFFSVAAGNLTFTASSTAITANTDINISQIATSTNFTSLNSAFSTQLGTRMCNTTAATSSPLVSIFASSTAPSLNGFTVTFLNAPTVNPACYSWSAQGF